MDTVSNISNTLSIKVIIHCNDNPAPLEFSFAPKKLTWESLTVLLRSSLSSLELPITLYYRTVAQPDLISSLENQEQLLELLSVLLGSLPPSASNNDMMTLRLYMDKEQVITPVFVSSSAAFTRLCHIVDQHQQIIQSSRRIVHFIGMLGAYIVVNGYSGNQSFEPEFSALEKMIERKGSKMEQQQQHTTVSADSDNGLYQPDHPVVLSADEQEEFQDPRLDPGNSGTTTSEDQDFFAFARPSPPPPHPFMAGPFGPHHHHHHHHRHHGGQFFGTRSFGKGSRFGAHHPRWQQEGDHTPLFQGLSELFWNNNHHHGPHYSPPPHRGPFGGGPMHHAVFGHFSDKRSHHHPPPPPFGGLPGRAFFIDRHGGGKKHPFGDIGRGWKHHPWGCERPFDSYMMGGGPEGPEDHYRHSRRHGFSRGKRHCHRHRRGSISSVSSESSTSSSTSSDSDMDNRKEKSERRRHHPHRSHDKAHFQHRHKQHGRHQDKEAEALSKDFGRLHCKDVAASLSEGSGSEAQQHETGKDDVYVLSKREFKKLLHGGKGHSHGGRCRPGGSRKHRV